MNEKMRKNKGVHFQNYSYPIDKCPIVPNLVLN